MEVESINRFVEAAAEGDIDTLKELLGQKLIHIDDYDESGFTALAKAAHCAQLEAVKWLLSMGADINKEVNIEEYEDPPILWGIASKDLSVVRYLLNNGAKLDIKSNYYETPLILAATCGSKEIIEYLLENGLDINETDVIGRTPLIWAVYDHMGPEIIEALIARGCDIDIRDASGFNAFKYSYVMNNTQAAKILLRNGASDSDIPESWITKIKKMESN